MNVLMVSIDRKILEEGSAVRARMVEYGTICDELHIIIPTHNLQFTRQNFAKQNLGGQATHNQRIQISENVFAYPAVGSNRIFTLFQVYRLGIRILATSYQLPATSSLVTSQDPFETGFVAWLVARKTKAKLQLQIHTDFLSPYFAKESILNKIRVLIAKFILPKADCIRAASLRISDSLTANNYKLKTSPAVLPIFIDAPKIMSAAPQFNLHKKYPQFDFIVLTTARLEPEKNITLALMAMKKVIAEYPRVGFIIVGSGSEMKNLKLKTIDYRLKTSVIFAGWQDDLVSYYKTADLYISTSDYEGYGLSLVEAALSGCPIVTTDVGIAGSVLKDGESALVCAPRDASCLSGKVLKIIADKELQKRLKRAALAEVLGKVSKNKEEYLSEYKKTWGIKKRTP
ncbi:MAG: glycosyltransferase family 4 protein [Patescibacteria group bacterium]